MPIHRRQFFLGSAALGFQAAAVPALPASEPKIRAIAFDAFPILDPRPIASLVEELFPVQAANLTSLWRTRQFEYTWLRNSMQDYADFQQVTEDALVYAAKSLKLELTPAKRARLMDAYLDLKTWPDVVPVLHALKAAGLRLAFLSNFTARMLNAGIENSGLQGVFDHVLSTDRVKMYKPSGRAYQMGVDAFRLKRSEILFVAFAGWDAAGARHFGYPTFWVNRLQSPLEELNVTPDAAGATMDDLIRWLRLPAPSARTDSPRS